jgi:hypothetical protein
MARFYFPISDGHSFYPDKVGTGLRDLADAKDFASFLAEEMAEHDAYTEFHVQVVDSAGAFLGRAYVMTRR